MRTGARTKGDVPQTSLRWLVESGVAKVETTNDKERTERMGDMVVVRDKPSLARWR